jgi:hypothetical protein
MLCSLLRSTFARVKRQERECMAAAAMTAVVLARGGRCIEQPTPRPQEFLFPCIRLDRALSRSRTCTDARPSSLVWTRRGSTSNRPRMSRCVFSFATPLCANHHTQVDLSCIAPPLLPPRNSTTPLRRHFRDPTANATAGTSAQSRGAASAGEARTAPRLAPFHLSHLAKVHAGCSSHVLLHLCSSQRPWRLRASAGV